jgi:hypothetical protein
MAEVVVYGTGQKFNMPLIGRAGKDIMVTGRAGEETITIARITVDETERRVVPNNVPSVIRAVSELGASYPDVAQLLIQARDQSNLVSRLEFDALPKAGRVYIRPDEEFKASYQKKSRIGRPTMAPNIFNDDNLDSDRVNEEDEYENETNEESLAASEALELEEVGEASSADVTTPEEESSATATVPLTTEEASTKEPMTEEESKPKTGFFNRGERESLYPSPFSFFKRSEK